MTEEITREQQHVTAPSPGRVTRLFVHLLSPGRCHCNSIAIFARRSHLVVGGGSAAAVARPARLQPPARLASKPSRHSSATSRSRCSPWISMRPSFTPPPAPHRRLNRVASSSSCAASNVSPLTTVTPCPRLLPLSAPPPTLPG